MILLHDRRSVAFLKMASYASRYCFWSATGMERLPENNQRLQFLAAEYGAKPEPAEVAIGFRRYAGVRNHLFSCAADPHNRPESGRRLVSTNDFPDGCTFPHAPERRGIPEENLVPLHGKVAGTFTRSFDDNCAIARHAYRKQRFGLLHGFPRDCRCAAT